MYPLAKERTAKKRVEENASVRFFQTQTSDDHVTIVF